MTTLALDASRCILGIESSCDETAVAVIGGGSVLSSVIRTQNDIHRDFGGVVPELASREHSRVITSAIAEALENAKERGMQRPIEAVAVTRGPGLAGALMVGVSAAKAVSLSLEIPLIGVDHMEGHLFGCALERPMELPALVLLVSGGHSMFIRVEMPGAYEYLGGTIDDAAGEAFDKVARLLNLRFPGGPEIERLAVGGDDSSIAFPRPMSDGSLDLSFSGLKTSVLHYLKRTPEASRPDVAASFEEAVVDVLSRKAAAALKRSKYRSIAIGGGVAANSRLRSRIVEVANAHDVESVIPSRRYCTDNGAMIAAAGAYRLSIGETMDIGASIDPSLELC